MSCGGNCGANGGCNVRSCCRNPLNAFSYYSYYWPNACCNNGTNSVCGLGSYLWNW